MSLLNKIKDEVARDFGNPNWRELLYWSSSTSGFEKPNAIDEVARRYAQAVAQDALKRASDGACIEIESKHGKTLHGVFNSEDPQWVARVSVDSIINTEINLL